MSAVTMTRLLIRRAGDNTWRTPEVTAYDDEAALKKLLAESPHLLPGINAGTAVTVTEFPVPGGGSADLVCVDINGNITIVECKLSANTEMRRYVIGQVFTYAAAITTMDYAMFDAKFSARNGRSLTELLVGEIKDGNFDEDVFRETVSDNLSDSRLRLIIAVDEITGELQRVVRFINRNTTSDIDFLAIELRYIKDSEVEILTPRVYGEESADDKTTLPRLPWSEEVLIKTLEKNLSSSGMQTFYRLRAYLLERGSTYDGGKARKPSGTYSVPVDGVHRPLIAIYTGDSSVNRLDRMSIAFGNLPNHVDEARLRQFRTAISNIVVFTPFLMRTDGSIKSYPEFPIEGVLTEQGVLESIENAISDLTNTGS